LARHAIEGAVSSIHRSKEYSSSEQRIRAGGEAWKLENLPPGGEEKTLAGLRIEIVHRRGIKGRTFVIGRVDAGNINTM